MATTPPWIVQSSPTGSSSGLPAPSGSPPWIVKSNPSTPTTPVPVATGFDPTKKGTHESYFDVNRDVRGMFTSNSGGEGGSDVFNEEAYNQYMKDRPEVAGVVNNGESWVGGEGGSLQKTTTTNYDKLPNGGATVLKDSSGKNVLADQVFRVTDPSQVKDPRAIKFDPTYGWITPASNRRPTNQIGLGVMGATLGVLGGFTGAGSLLSAARGGLQGAFNGNLSPTSLGLSALGASGYVPSWVVPAVKAGMSLSQMYGKG